MKKYLLFFIIMIAGYSINAHPWKPKYYVIIDTDGGFDDYRAINFLLASPDVRVLAITTSNGVIGAEYVYIKIRSLLQQLHHEGLLVGINADSTSMIRNCTPALNFAWGDTIADIAFQRSAIDVVNYIISKSNESITLICLGSLSTPAICHREIPLFEQRINQIIWTTDLQLDTSNFNYSVNPTAYKYLTEHQNLLLHRINGGIGESIYNEKLVGLLDSVQNSYAKNITKSLSIQDTPFSNRWYDESAVIFLQYPVYFSSDTLDNSICHRFLPDSSLELNDKLIQIVTGNVVNQNQVLEYFPLDSSDYQDDVRSIMMQTISNYGKEEWISEVIANELHRHVGVYAVVGAKMGIRAREYFAAGVDELIIHSHAGQKQPISCMNDGLQVSTGATLGHGLMHIDLENEPYPGAEFTYLGQTIELVLKDEYRNRIKKQITELNSIYGLNNDIYWALVRNLALYYWKNWDRNQIFEIRITPSGYSK